MKNCFIRLAYTAAVAAIFLFYGGVSLVPPAIASEKSDNLLLNGNFNSITTLFEYYFPNEWDVSDFVDVEGEGGSYNLIINKQGQYASQKITNLLVGNYEFSINLKTEGAITFKLSAKAGESTIATVSYSVNNVGWKRFALELNNTAQSDVTFIIEITENAEQKSVRLDDAEVILSNIKTESGAEIRIDETSGGLRFKAQVKKAYYDAMVARYGKTNVAAGVMIVPTDYITTDFTYEDITEEGKEPLTIIADKWNNDGNADEYYGYSCAITDILLQNTDRKFSVRAFLRYEDGESTKYEYAAYDESKHSRSVFEVAKKALADEPSEYERVFLQRYIDKVKYETLTEFDEKGGSVYEIAYACQSKGLLIITDKERLKEGIVKIFVGDNELNPQTDDGRTIYVIPTANTTITIRYTKSVGSQLFVMDSLQITYYVKPA